MNRRCLILTTLGALAGCLGLPKVARAERGYRCCCPQDGSLHSHANPDVALASDEVIAGLVSRPKVPIAEMYISVSQDVNEALSKETTVVSKQPPLITIGSLIVANEAEAEAFLKRMADAIRKASQPGSSRPGASY